MSLYRQPGRVAARTLALAAGAALVVGLVAGYALGRGTAPKPSLADKVADLRAELRPAQQGLELTGIEYAEAVRGGRVVSPTEYRAAQADATRARDAVAGARADLRALNPVVADTLERSVRALAAAVARREDPARVRRIIELAGRALGAMLPR